MKEKISQMYRSKDVHEIDQRPSVQEVIIKPINVSDVLVEAEKPDGILRS